MTKECYEFIRQLHACILFICNIHVARHVDIDGIHVDNEHASNRGLYLQTVDKARHLVRTLELVVQALYDDSAAFFLSTQAIRRDTSAPSNSRNAVIQLALSLRDNLDLVCQTFEALLSVGHEQAELGLGDYNGSIEWRMSRISIIDSQFGNAISANSNQDGEQVVDMALALRRPEAKSKASADIPEPFIFYPDLSYPTETSLLDERHTSAEDLSIVPRRSSEQTTAPVGSRPLDASSTLGLGKEGATFIDDDSRK
jgi:son of sevenless